MIDFPISDLKLIFTNMINFQLLVDFIGHQFKAKTRHGVHSPFVYRLLDQVIYDFRGKMVYQEIEELRSTLLRDEQRITITDYGAGSLVNNNKQRQVKDIARNALKPARIAQLIYRLVEDLNPRNSIELGTCLGITTAYLAKAVPDTKIYSIEGCPMTAAIASENLKKLHLTNVEVLVGNFDVVLPGLIEELPEIDFVFIDGNHTKKATLDYFNRLLTKLSPNSLIIFDDIYWSTEMKEAWQEIKSHSEVSVTIDLFRMGLAFVRRAQEKEDFYVRF